MKGYLFTIEPGETFRATCDRAATTLSNDVDWDWAQTLPIKGGQRSLVLLADDEQAAWARAESIWRKYGPFYPVKWIQINETTYGT